jgi:5'-3' exonuclease
MKRVVLIDLSAIYWTNFHISAESGIREPRAATVAAVKRIAGDEAGLIAICCDSGKSFRKELAPTYKANREKQPQAAYGELEKTKERLRLDGFLLWEVEGFEADDVIATAWKHATDAGHEVRIATSDKDLLQLAGVRTDVLRTHTWTVVTSRDVLEKFHIEPEQMRDFLALKGDTSDNIPGCPKIGDITASKLLTTYETIDRIYEALDAGKEVATKSIEASLRDHKADVMLSRQLVTLRYDVPLNFQEIYEERQAKPLTNVEDDAPEIVGPKDGASAGESAENAEVSVSSNSENSSESAQGALVMAPVEFTRQLEPRSFRELTIGCKILFNARIYEKYPSYESMVGAALRGREMGYGLGASLDVFHVMDINGKRSLALHAHAIVDRALQDPDCEYIECLETTGEKATYALKRRSRPKPFEITYTIEQARQAGLIRPRGNWELRPAEQLRKTAAVQGCRVVFPGAAMGLYCMAELGADE